MVLLIAPNASMVRSSSIFRLAVRIPRFRWSCLTYFHWNLGYYYRDTSSGARAMRGSGAVDLLRRSRCVFLAPQCAALRCPWMSALVVPVVRVPSCARGPPCVFVYCTCTTELHCSTVVLYEKRADTNHERTKFHLI